MSVNISGMVNSPPMNPMTQITMMAVGRGMVVVVVAIGCGVDVSIRVVPPNEKEMSHGRVSWQTDWAHLAMGPLASSIG